MRRCISRPSPLPIPALHRLAGRLHSHGGRTGFGSHASAQDDAAESGQEAAAEEYGGDYAGHQEEADAYAAPHLDGGELGLISVVPFVGILLSIAVFPLVVPHFWHRNFGSISAFWAPAFLVSFAILFGCCTSPVACRQRLAHRDPSWHVRRVGMTLPGKRTLGSRRERGVAPSNRESKSPRYG